MNNINQNTRITLLRDLFCYKAKDFYLLTIPKIASSWAYQLFLHNEGLRDVPENEIYKFILKNWEYLIYSLMHLNKIYQKLFPFIIK